MQKDTQTEALLQRKRALRWRARRGMWELDLILNGWLDRVLPTMRAPEVTVCELLLEQTDTDLYDWLRGQGHAQDAQLTALVQTIIASHAENPPTA